MARHNVQFALSAWEAVRICQNYKICLHFPHRQANSSKTVDLSVRLPSFASVNGFMNVWAFANLCLFALCIPMAMSAPGQTPGHDPNDKLIFPTDPETAAPLVVRIAFILLLSLVLLIPATWILSVQLAVAKRGGPVIGWIILALAAIVAIHGLSTAYDNTHSAPAEALFGSSAAFGLSVALGTYLVLYSKWLYRLNLQSVAPAGITEGRTIGISLSPESRQLLGRLALYAFLVVFALGASAILSLLPQLKDSPYFITMGFFGVVAIGMVATGMIREETLSSILSWTKSDK